MAVNDEYEWDGTQWGPVTDAPNRYLARWNYTTGEWQLVKPAERFSPILNSFGNAFERGWRDSQQSMNLVQNALGIQSDEATAHRIAQLERRKQQIAAPPDIRDTLNKIDKAETFGEALDAVVENPSSLLSVAGQSLGAMAPDILGIIMPGGIGFSLTKAAVPAIAKRLVAALGMGASSGRIEYASTLLNELAESGVPISDETQLLEALTDPDLIASIRPKALKRGIPIAAFDAISVGMAGKAYEALNTATSSMRRRALGAASEVGMGAGLGAAGEASAQLTDEGRISSPGNVLMEAVAEGFGAPFEALSAIYMERQGHVPTVEEVHKVAVEQRLTPDEAVEVLAAKGLDPSSFTSDENRIAAASRVLQRDIEEAQARQEAREKEYRERAAKIAVSPSELASRTKPITPEETQNRVDKLDALEKNYLNNTLQGDETIAVTPRGEAFPQAPGGPTVYPDEENPTLTYYRQILEGLTPGQPVNIPPNLIPTFEQQGVISKDANGNYYRTNTPMPPVRSPSEPAAPLATNEQYDRAKGQSHLAQVTDQLALPEPDRHATPFGNLTGPEIDTLLENNRDVPRIASILDADIPLADKRGTGLQALADMGPIKKGPSLEPKARVGEVPEQRLNKNQEFVPLKRRMAVWNPKTKEFESKDVQLYEQIDRLFDSYPGASQQQVRELNDALRKLDLHTRNKKGEPTGINPRIESYIRDRISQLPETHEVPELPEPLRSKFTEEGLIEAGDRTGTLRRARPLPSDLPDTLTPENYNKLLRTAEEMPKGTTFPMPMVRKVTGLKPGEAKSAIDYLTKKGILKAPDKPGKPATVFRSLPTEESLPPEAPVSREVKNAASNLVKRIAGQDVRTSFAPQDRLNEMAGTLGQEPQAVADRRGVTISENIPEGNVFYAAIHEAVHQLHILGKFLDTEMSAILSPDGQRRLRQIIDWGARQGYRGKNQDLLRSILKNKTPTTGDATVGQLETLAYAAEVEAFRRAHNLKYDFTPPGLIKRILNKILEFTRSLFKKPNTNAFRAQDILEKAVSGEFANRPRSSGTRFEATMQQVNHDTVAAQETRSLPEVARQYYFRAEKAVHEKDVIANTSPYKVRAPGPSSSPLKPPDTTDLPQSLNWFNWFVNSLRHLAVSHPALRPYATAVYATDRIAARLRRKFQDAVADAFRLNERDNKLLADWLIVSDATAGRAKVTELNDGSKRMQWNKGQELTPLPSFMPKGDIVLPKSLVPLADRIRKAFEDFHKEMIQATLARFGLPENSTPESIRAEAATKTGKARDRMLSMADVIEESTGYHVQYFPHDRPYTKDTVQFMFEKDGEPTHVFNIKSPWGKASSFRRAAKILEKVQKRLGPEGYTATDIKLLSPTDLVQQLQGAQAADIVQILGQLVLKGENNQVAMDSEGHPITQLEVLLDALTDIREEAVKQGFARRTRQRKFVPGYLHEGNYKTYLNATLADYFTRGAEWLAQNYTARDRTQAISNLMGKHPELARYAKKREDYLTSPEGIMAKVRAITFHYALGFNVSSAALNALQMLHTTYPYLAQMGSPLRAGPQIMKAYRDAMNIAIQNLNTTDPDLIFRLDKKPSFITQDEWDLLKLARAEGITEPLLTSEYEGGVETNALLNEAETKFGHLARWVSKRSSFAFSVIEQGNRMATLLAAYRLAKSDPKVLANMRKWAETTTIHGENAANMSIEDLAMMAVEETQYNLTKSNRPLMLQGVGGAIFQFSQYPIYTMELMCRAAVHAGGKGFFHSKDGKVMLALMTLGIWSTAGAMGIPLIGPATSGFDELANRIAPVLGYKPPNLKGAIREGLTQIMEELSVDDPVKWTTIAMKGAVRQATGISLEQRTALDWPNIDMMTGNFLDSIGPFGGIIGGGIQDAANYYAQGNNAMAIASLLPLAVRNMFRGILVHPTLTDAAGAAGYPVATGGKGIPSPITGNTPVRPGDISNWESAMLMAGFTPSRLADLREAAREMTKPNPMAKVRDNLADQLSQILGQMILLQQEGKREAARALRKQYEDIVEATLERDLSEKDPRNRIVNNWDSFYKDRVLKRVQRNYIEGPFGAVAHEHIARAERGPTDADLNRYFRYGPNKPFERSSP